METMRAEAHIDERRTDQDPAGVSVCFPTFRRPELLKEAIDSICRNRHRPIEIVVSDNDFTNASAQRVRGLRVPDGVRVVRRGNPGATDPSSNSTIRKLSRAASASSG
jgi:Glycosyl transferase family 2